MIACSTCKEVKTEDSFPIRKNRKKLVSSACYDCKNIRAKEYRERPEIKSRINEYQNSDEYRVKHNEYEKIRYASNEKSRLQMKDKALLRMYGITLEQYNLLLINQNYKCKICNDPPGKRNLAVDHDHNTGSVRGLLCDSCNRGIGLLKDKPEVLMKAAEYILGKKSKDV